MNLMLNLLKKFLILGAFLIFICFSMLIYFLWKVSPELPSYNELKSYNPSLTSRVFTSDGLLLDKYFIQERIFVPINRIPKNLIYAFISAEDKKFFEHIGIDPLAIIRAVFTNIVNSNEIIEQEVKEYLICGMPFHFKEEPLVKNQHIKRSNSVSLHLKQYLSFLTVNGGKVAINITCQNLSGANYTASDEEFLTRWFAEGRTKD